MVHIVHDFSILSTFTEHSVYTQKFVLNVAKGKRNITTAAFAQEVKVETSGIYEITRQEGKKRTTKKCLWSELKGYLHSGDRKRMRS